MRRFYFHDVTLYGPKAEDISAALELTSNTKQVCLTRACVSSQADEDSDLLSILAQDHQAYFLTSDVSHIEPAITLPPGATGTPVLLIVGESRRLYSPRLAEGIVNRLLAEGALHEHRGVALRLLLHEAITNAIEHGNLQINSSLKHNSPDKQQYYTEVFKALETDAGNKPVAIYIFQQHDGLHIWIQDTGPGFDVKELPEPDPEAYHGRGIPLIQAIAAELQFEDQGRRLYFRFSRDERDHFFHLPTLEEAKSTGTILIVDDQESNRIMLRHYLTNAGFDHIVLATSGQEAMDQIRTHLPDLILLDVIMDDMNGFDVCRTLKSTAATRDIPVLLLTGLKDRISRAEGFNVGAVDYILKPVEPVELISRVGTHLLSSKNISHMRRMNTQMMQDLRAARTHQAYLMPTPQTLSDIGARFGLEMGSLFEPCERLAGDYWNVFVLNDESVFFILTDFTGHGTSAAMHTIYLHTLCMQHKALMSDPARFITRVNNDLHQMLAVDQFATAICATYHMPTRTLHYAACGSPSPAYVPADSKKTPTFIPSAGLPLGLTNSGFTPTTGTLQPDTGDLLFFYSDALTEAEHTNGPPWEQTGLMAHLMEEKNCPPAKMPKRMTRALKRTAKMPLKDDLTLLAVGFV